MKTNIDLGVEYAHIYIDQQFSVQHQLGVEHLKQYLAVLGTNKSVSKVVLIDDYSPGITLDRFDLNSFITKLNENNAKPDVVVLESELITYCEQIIDILTNKKIKRNIKQYYKSRGKYPCSLFVAAWYLLRLKAFGEPSIKCIVGTSNMLYSDKLVTILPDSFVTSESQATEIIKATKYAKYADNIEHVYFEHQEEIYSGWGDFDADEYVVRNYGRRILPEDKQIIDFVVNSLDTLGLEPRSLNTVADVGAGPNLYPSLLISPYIADEGRLDLIDFSHQNINYLSKTLTSIRENKHTTWERFQEYINKSNQQSNLSKVAALSRIVEGSIFELPKGEYDAVMSFFVSDSITDSYETFGVATSSLMASLKPGGIFILAHMIGSHGYFAGERTFFPAVDLNLQQLETEYSSYGTFISYLVTHENKEAVRKGYKGMAVFVGKKIDSTQGTINVPDKLNTSAKAFSL